MTRTPLPSLTSKAARQARAVGRKGFTLLELLLATAIFAIVVAAINTVFFASLHLRRSVSDALDQAVPLEHALAVIRRDLQNAVAPGGSLAGHFRSSGPAGTLAAAAGGVTGLANSGSTLGGQNGGLDFFTSTGVINDDVPWGDIQEVNYQLVPPEQTDQEGKDLVRTVTRNLLTYLPAPEMQRLVSKVDVLEFEYYDGLQWRDTWDTTAGDDGIPSAVRVRMFFVPEKTMAAKQEPLEMVVLLNVRGGTNSTSTAEDAL